MSCSRWRPALLMAPPLLLACRVGLGYPDLLFGEVVTNDQAVVDCPVRLWRGAIGPLDGKGEPLALGSVKTGAPFEVLLEPTSVADPGQGRLWVTIECPGYHVKLRGVQWRALDEVFPTGFDIGRVWVFRK